MEYEGQYLSGGKWDGKGFDNNGNIIYELIKGNGTIKDYVNDILTFDGEYKNGMKWKGKQYNSKGELIFEGEYLNGKKRKGKERNMILKVN